MKNILTLAVLSAIYLFTCLVHSLDAQNTATFLNPQAGPPVNCLDSWVEDNIPMQIVPHSGGGCDFDYTNVPPGDLWLFAARLNVDLTPFTNGIDSIKVRFTDYCGIGCSVDTISFMGNTVAAFGNTTVSQQEEWVWKNPNKDPVDLMQMQSFEGIFHEILIYPCPTTPTTCDADDEVSVEKGGVYIEDACYGVILTSPNGTCYRIRVDDNGGIITEQIACP